MKTNVSSLIFKNIPPNQNKEFIDSIINGENLNFILSESNKVIIKMPGKTFAYDIGLQEWIVADNYFQLEIGLYKKLEELGLNNIDCMEFTDLLNDQFEADLTKNVKPNEM